MFKTEKTVTLLKSIAMVAGLAIILWSLGLPTLRFADAANITSVSDTLSDSAPSASADHTIEFVTPSGVANGETIVIDLSEGFTNGAGVDHTDIDIAGTSDFTVAGDCTGSDEVGADFAGLVLTLTFCPGDGAVLSAGATTTIEIGLNATADVAGDAQLVNSASEGSYEIGFTVGSQDSGWTRVVILTAVTVSATVDTIFTFAVAGVAAGEAVNGATTTGSTASTSINFGTLEAGVATTTAQDLTVTTNAANGYAITVQLDQPLRSSTGATIDGFAQGSDTDDPSAWVAPTAVLGSANTYGHWGFTSDDADTIRTNEFASGEFAAASTTPRVVMSHDGPANGTGTGEGTTRVGYRVEISSLQEAGDDYTATLTYVATPTF